MDLGTLASRCSGVRWLEDTRFRFDCPINTQHTVVARQVGNRIIIVCLAHDPSDAILDAFGLAGDDLTIAEVSDDTRNSHASNKPADPAARSSSGSGPAEPRRPQPQEGPTRGSGSPTNDFPRLLPPQNLEAEQSVLGAVLIDNETLPTVRQILSAADFYLDKHRTIFTGMCALVDRGEPIDAITIKNWLKSHSKLDQIGGPTYIAELASVVPSPSSVRYYATMVRDAAVKRCIANSATEIATMAYNGVQADSLIGEWQRRVNVLDRGLMLPAEIPWEDVDSATAINDAYLGRQPVIDRLCYSTALSMITGGKHAGKSTLARWMAICVAKGIPFLNREVVQGPVLYVASEDEEMAARLELVRLGWPSGGALRFFGKSKIRSDDFDFLGMLTKEIQRHHAVLVVVDMLFDFIHVDDEMSYAGTRRAVGQIQDVASDSGAHLCVLHHAPKNANIGDATIAALGSQGLAARVSPIILVRRFGQGVHSISSTSVRDPRGQALEEARLIRHEDGSVQLGGAFKNYMLAEVYAERVYELLADEPGSEMTASDISAGLDLSYQVARSCVWFLYSNNRIGRSGEGKKGRPYRYYVPLTGIRQTTENSESEILYSPRTSTQSESFEELQRQGRFGYKENEWTPPTRPDPDDPDDDLDEHGISRSK